MNATIQTTQEIDVEIPKKWLQALKFAEMVKNQLDMQIPPAEMVMLIVSLSRGNESAAAIKSQD